MIKYIKKQKLNKTNNKLKYIYFEINGKIKKKISSRKYYKNKNKNRFGGSKGITILRKQNNTPISENIKKIVQTNKNLLSILSKHDLENRFERVDDIVIHGINYASYKTTPKTLDLIENLKTKHDIDILGNHIVYKDRNINDDLFIWNYKTNGASIGDIEYGIFDPTGQQLNPLTNERYSKEYVEYAKNWSGQPIYDERNTIISIIEQNQVILIKSGTGSGKTVIVPKIALHVINYGYGYTNDIENRQKNIEKEKKREEERLASLEGEKEQNTFIGNNTMKRESKIVVTLPKQIITSETAEWAAKTLDVELGKEVGFKHLDSEITNDIDNETKSSYSKNETILLYATDGTLEQKLIQFPTLRDEYGKNLYNIIIIDEVHERNSRIDFILYMLKYALKHNNTLKLILMSATIDTEPFKKFFSEFKYQEFTASSQTPKPITDKWIDTKNSKSYIDEGIKQIKNILENQITELDDEDVTDPEYERMKYIKTLYDNISKEDRQTILNVQDPTQIPELQDIELLNPKGAILMFVPNMSNKDKICNELKEFKDNLFLNTNVYCTGLDGKIAQNKKQKDLVIDPIKYKSEPNGPYGRKVVIATNAAESSITIKELSYVIDSGYEKSVTYNPDKMITQIEEKRCTQAQAKQRWGRVGRTKPGVCIRLYSKDEFDKNFEEFPEPDLLTTDCLPYILRICDMVETQNIYSELLQDRHKNIYNIKRIKKLMTEPDFFLSPIKENYFDSSYKILDAFDCFDKKNNFTINFYILKEIYNILIKFDKKISFTIMDARVIIESVIFDCLDETLEFILCYKFFSSKGLSGIFPTEMNDKLRTKPKNYDLEDKLLKTYKKTIKKFINNRSDHLTLFHIYKNYEEKTNIKGEELDQKWEKNNSINYQSFKKLKKKITKSKYSLIPTFKKYFKLFCKQTQDLPYPDFLKNLNDIDYGTKFQEFFLDPENQSKYSPIVSFTITELFNKQKNLSENSDYKLIDSTNGKDIKDNVKKIFDISNDTLKSQIIRKLTEIFNKELPTDNTIINHTIDKIILQINNDDNENLKNKLMYSLYMNLSDDNSSQTDDDRFSNSEKNKIDLINIQNDVSNINNLDKKLLKCLLSGYKIHLAQQVKNNENDENDLNIIQYNNCFPKDSITLNWNEFSQKNRVSTVELKKITDKKYEDKYIIYDNISRNIIKQPNKDEPTNYDTAYLITIIPQNFVHSHGGAIIPTNDDNGIKGNGKCSW